MAIVDTVVAHIGHAEQWLRRARADYDRGDLRQVVLRLLLAEAEIRRARESGAAIAALPPRRSTQVPWAILGVVTAAVLILAGIVLIRSYAAGPAAQVRDEVQAGHGRGRVSGIVRFESGQMLPFVDLPARPSGTVSGAAWMDVDRLVTISDEGSVFVTSR